MEVDVVGNNGENLKQQRARHSIALLLAFIFFTEFLPCESFLPDFFRSKGLTQEEITDSVFPLFIYFRFPFILGAGLLAEYVGPGLVIFLGSMFGCATIAITTWARSLFLLQVTQLTVSVSTATHMGALYAFLFQISSEISSTSWQVHVFQAKAALLVSNLVASAIGSVLRNLEVPYEYISGSSLITQAASVVVAAALVIRQRSPPRCMPCGKLFLMTFRNFRFTGVSRWTLWAVSFGTVHLLVTTYWTSLVKVKMHGHTSDFNGYVSALCFAVGSILLCALGHVKALSKRQNRWWIVSSTLLAGGALVLAMGINKVVGAVFASYICFQLFYRIGSATATMQVAAEMQEMHARQSIQTESLSTPVLQGLPSLISARSSDAEEESVGTPRDGALALTSSQSFASRPPLALLFGITELLTSLSQVLLQYVIKHPYIIGYKESSIKLDVRFEVMGACLLAIGFVYVLLLDGPSPFATLLSRCCSQLSACLKRCCGTVS